MNSMLTRMATNLPKTRQELGWTQADLAKRTGISRPVVVAVEKDPSKMTKTYALAIFMVVYMELTRRTDKLNALALSLTENPRNLPSVLKEMSEYGLTFPRLKSAIIRLIRHTGIFLERKLRDKSSMSEVEYEKIYLSAQKTRELRPIIKNMASSDRIVSLNNWHEYYEFIEFLEQNWDSLLDHKEFEHDKYINEALRDMANNRKLVISMVSTIFDVVANDMIKLLIGNVKDLSHFEFLLDHAEIDQTGENV